VRLRAGIEAGEDLKEAGHGAQAGHDHFLARDDGGRGAQLGIDGEVGGGVLGGLVFHQGLLQQCVDAVLFQSMILVAKNLDRPPLNSVFRQVLRPAVDISCAVRSYK
jgi:hypothetical protein